MVRDMWAVKVVWWDGTEHLDLARGEVFDSRSLAREKAREWNRTFSDMPRKDRISRYVPIRIRVQEVGKG